MADYVIDPDLYAVYPDRPEGLARARSGPRIAGPRLTAVLATVTAILVGATGCAEPTVANDLMPATHRQPSNPVVDRPPAEEVLAGLPVKGRAPKTGYNRDEFPHWNDADHDGCDTRAEILARDSTAATTTDRHGCVVGTTIDDPYSGHAVVEGPGRGSEVDIDHLVALSDAWQKGAQQLTLGQREQLANDPLNLVAVDDGLNRKKSDGDAATWLPPNKDYRCAYVAGQVAVKDKYGLWVTPAEHDAIARVLGSCPAQTLPGAQS